MFKEIYNKVEEAAKRTKTDNAVVTFYTIRKAVGWIGMLIPVVLIGCGYLFDACHTVQPSISHYYYTNARELFVGALCAVSLFMFCYKGFSRIDNMSANMAGLFALMVALFPANISTPAYPCQQPLASLTDVPYSGTIHLVAATAFFLTLTFMSVFLFTLSNKSKHQQGERKKMRNGIYYICGGIMFSCIVAIAIYFAFDKREEETIFTLVCESVALLAFGISWLTKGEAILPDKGEEKK